MTRAQEDQVLRVVNKALDAQFGSYSWSDMIADIPDLTADKRRFAKEHIGYKTYIEE